MRRTLAGLLLVAGFAGLARAEDWPQWHGLKRDNTSPETGLLPAWPAGGPRLAWKLTGLGGGYSSVAVAGGKLLTMGDTDGAEYVLAFDLATRRKLWATRVGPEFKNGNGAGPRCTPTVDGKLAYALTPQGDLVCLQVADGQQVWRKQLSRDFSGKMMSGWGYSESPLVDGDRLICTPGGADGTVIALNKQSGAPVWRSTALTDPATYALLVAADILGTHQIVVLTSAHVAGLAADSGKVLWSAPRAGKVAVCPTPVVGGNHVFVASGYGIGCNLFEISGGGGAFGAKEVYASKALVNHHGGYVLVKDQIYGYSDPSGWTCLNFLTGAVAWNSKKLGKGTLLYADGRLYLRAESGPGTLALIAATPEGYREISRFDQPDRTSQKAWAHLAISDGKLFVRDQDALLCYDIQKP